MWKKPTALVRRYEMLRYGIVIASLLFLCVGSGYSIEGRSTLDDDYLIFQFDDFDGPNGSDVVLEEENNVPDVLDSVQLSNEDRPIFQRDSQFDNIEDDIILEGEEDSASIQCINYEADLNFKTLSSEEMIKDLIKSYKEYNNCRLNKADAIQSMFIKLVVEEGKTVEKALETLVYDMIVAAMQIESSLASKSKAERLVGLQKVLHDHELEIPKLVSYPIETIIPPRFHELLLSHYLSILTQGKLQNDIPDILYVVELLLGTKYATCLEDFWQIYSKEERFIHNQRKLYIRREKASELDENLSFQKILSLKKKFENKYDVDYCTILTMRSKIRA